MSSSKPPAKPPVPPEEPAAPELSLVDTGNFARGGLKNVMDPVKGYNPYDTGVYQNDNAPKPKNTDLRKLSEWIKAQRRAARNKGEDEKG